MRPRVAVLVALLAPSAATAAGPFDELLATVPGQSNVLVLVDVKKVLESPVGVRQDWSGKTKDRYRSGAGTMPPGADRVLISGLLDYLGGSWNWQAAVIDAADAPDIQDLARREHGLLDTVAGRPTVLSPRGAYFTTLNPNRLVVFHPANRQLLARWLSHARSAKQPTLSPFMAEAAGKVSTTPVVVALDMTDALDPNAMVRATGGLVSLAKRTDVDTVSLGRTLATARGVTLTAVPGEKIEATLRVDFAAGVGQFRPVLKDVFVELLEMTGASIPDLADWTATFPDRAMVLTGELSPESLVRILELFTFAHPQTTEPMAGDQPTATATRRYVEAVAGIAGDLAKLRTNASNPRQYEKTALWHETAAKKIEQLSPRGVDPAAVKYGADVAKRLRAIAGSMRGVPIDLDQLSKDQYLVYQTYPTGWGWGWWGWPVMGQGVNVQTNIPEVQAKMNKVVAEDEKKRVRVWGEIDEMTSKIRAMLAAKDK